MIGFQQEIGHFFRQISLRKIENRCYNMYKLTATYRVKCKEKTYDLDRR